MEIRRYRLKVCGSIEFTDLDKKLEDLFLHSCTTLEQVDRATQSLEEDCKEMSVEMVRI